MTTLNCSFIYRNRRWPYHIKIHRRQRTGTNPKDKQSSATLRRSRLHKNNRLRSRSSPSLGSRTLISEHLLRNQTQPLRLGAHHTEVESQPDRSRPGLVHGHGPARRGRHDPRREGGGVLSANTWPQGLFGQPRVSEGCPREVPSHPEH